MRIVHEIYKGATPVTGGCEAYPGRVTVCLVGRNEITGEADVLHLEGRDEDILAALDQIALQIRGVIVLSGRPDPHTYAKIDGKCHCIEHGCSTCDVPA